MDLIKCPVCGKSFIRAPEHIYKAVIDGGVKYLCSWSCFRKVQKENEENLKEDKNAGR